MIKKLLIASTLLFSTLLYSCDWDDDNNKDNPVNPIESDRYYVKYEASDFYYYLQQISVNTEKGIQTFTVERSRGFSQTFGPVKKGFSANITANVNSAGSTRTVSIYVSKGEEPFTLKQTGSTTASYVIDF